jgi:hypothetical protein
MADALVEGAPAGLESSGGDAAGGWCAGRRSSLGRSGWAVGPKPGMSRLNRLPRQGMINPEQVRFSQDSISGAFKGGEGTIEQLAELLRAGMIEPRSIAPIRLFERDGKLCTLDNRRLWSFRQAGVRVPFRKATPDEIRKEVPRKFNPIDDGRTIRVRGGP